MRHVTRKVRAPDGAMLYVESWNADVRPRFVAVIVHGAGEHVGRYERLASDLVARGGSVFGNDHRGQGFSEGPRGHIEDFHQYTLDLRHVMLEVASSAPDGEGPREIPWFLFGHSTGALIALHYLIEYQHDIPLCGAIMSSPLLKLAMTVPAYKRAVGRVAALAWPRLTLPSGIPPEDTCRSPEEVAKYQHDKRRTDLVSVGWFSAMERAVAKVEAQASLIEIPMLWYIGTGDRICDHTAMERLFAKLADAKARDQTLRKFEGYYHELHNEPDELRAPIVEMIGDWIARRIETRQAVQR